MTLRERILAADESLTAGDILAESSLVRLPKGLRDKIESLQIEWMPARNWGESFTFDEGRVRLGNRRGDHLATHPGWYGWSDREAEEILATQVEGTILHESGHALWDHFHDFSSRKRWNRANALLAQALESDGPVSTYDGGHCSDGEDCEDDTAGETFAEAFRWWCVSPQFDDAYPAWAEVVRYVVGFVAGE